MKKTTTIIRIVFGVLLLGIGLANLSGAMPPMRYPEPANTFMSSLLDTKYIMVIVSLLKVFVGVSLLTSHFVSLALIVFVPISVNMILFHAFLDVQGIVPALVVGSLHIFLLFAYMESYKSLLQAKKMNVRG
ncbi:hypothetical protein [Paenibacillus sp. V4I7]|uniref:hypothetical protein n=1 Tax=Paenibacillus sp. V4I7 TaxID=3042307 RepID=UPI00277DAA8B|nr:hypothetical protein [Paenibacillus sp. V4I7]MDQ0896563.1 putative oxidoreductase [Paenibacillus sp. V4I7]